MPTPSVWRRTINFLWRGIARGRFPGRMCRQYDLILVMEKRHIASLCEIAPEMRGKVVLFGHWDNEREIPDPFRKSREAFGSRLHLT